MGVCKGPHTPFGRGGLESLASCCEMAVWIMWRGETGASGDRGGQEKTASHFACPIKHICFTAQAVSVGFLICPKHEKMVSLARQAIGEKL